MKNKKAEIYPCSKYKALSIIYSDRSQSPHFKKCYVKKEGGNISKFSPHFNSIFIFKAWPGFNIVSLLENLLFFMEWNRPTRPHHNYTEAWKYLLSKDNIYLGSWYFQDGQPAGIILAPTLIHVTLSKTMAVFSWKYKKISMDLTHIPTSTHANHPEMLWGEAWMCIWMLLLNPKSTELFFFFN